MKKIRFYNEDIPKLKIDESLISHYIRELIKEEGQHQGDISIIFCSDNYLLKINKEFLAHDFYTDIVTFDYVSGDILSGDLYISIERIVDNADHFNVEFREELLRVIFHGILHLIGYDDNTQEKKNIIRKKENYYLKKFELCWQNMML